MGSNLTLDSDLELLSSLKLLRILFVSVDVYKTTYDNHYIKLTKHFFVQELSSALKSNVFEAHRTLSLSKMRCFTICV